MNDNHPYPALIIGGLTPAYDFFARRFLHEGRIKRALIAQARVAPGQRVLDLGAGTGTLAIWLKQVQPVAHIAGLDADPSVLALAAAKAARAGVQLDFCAGTAGSLPYADGTFDRVVSSLVFSMLSSAEKQRAAVESYRTLRRGGTLHIADFGPPHTAWARLLARRMRQFEPIRDNLDGRLPAMMQAAGFEEVGEAARFNIPLGTISLLRGRKPS